VVLDHVGDLPAECSGARAEDSTARADAVGVRDDLRGVEPALQLCGLGAEVRVQRQLAVDQQGRHEHDACATIGGKPAGEIERVHGLVSLEQGDEDAPVPDRLGPAGEAAHSLPYAREVGALHRRSWYGTEPRMTFGSNRSSRLR